MFGQSSKYKKESFEPFTLFIALTSERALDETTALSSCTFDVLVLAFRSVIVTKDSMCSRTKGFDLNGTHTQLNYTLEFYSHFLQVMFRNTNSRLYKRIHTVS